MTQKTSFALRVNSILLIAPAPILLQKLRRAIVLIKKTNRHEYRRLPAHLKIIFVTVRRGDTNEFFMPEKIWFANRSLISKSDLPWLASLIIHEAFHATQFKNGHYILPLAKLEGPALKVQRTFLARLKSSGAAQDIERVAKAKYWRRMRRDEKSSRHYRKLLAILKSGKLRIKRLPS